MLNTKKGEAKDECPCTYSFYLYRSRLFWMNTSINGDVVPKVK